MRGLSCALGLSLCGAVGCASNTAGLENELSLLRREVRTLSDKVATNQLELERLEGQMTTLTLGDEGEVAASPKTPVASRSESKDEPKISQINGPNKKLPVVRITNQSSDDVYAQGAIDDGSPPIMIKLKGEASERGDVLPVDKGVLSKPDPVLSERRPRKAKRKASKAEIKAAYEIARAKLRVENQPTKARALFLDFQSQFGDTRYADNVAYWLAECDFREKKYQASIGAFHAMIASHPRSPKVPFALLRSAEASAAVGDHRGFARLLRRVIDEHPESEAATQAKARLAASKGQR